MKPIKQDIFSDGRDGAIPGNCFQAAVASIFELGLVNVPHFVAGHTDWFFAFHDWLISHNGLYPLSFNYSESIIFDLKGYCLVTGMAKRGLRHTVVYKDGKLAHDPHPDNSGLIHPESICIFVDPCRGLLSDIE